MVNAGSPNVFGSRLKAPTLGFTGSSVAAALPEFEAALTPRALVVVGAAFLVGRDELAAAATWLTVVGSLFGGRVVGATYTVSAL